MAGIQTVKDYKKSRAQKRNQTELDSTLDMLLREDRAGGMKKLRQLIAIYQKAASSAAAEHAKLLEDARRPDADGVVRYTDEEKAGVAAAYERFKQATEMGDRYREQLRQSGEKMAQGQNFGGWSVKNLNSLLGGSSADRTAAATERANQLTTKTHQKLDALIKKTTAGLTYGD